MSTPVLVTRAPHQAESLLEPLREAGFDARHLPALAITGVDPETIQSGFTPEPTPDIAVFVSANAVQFGFDALALPDTTTFGAIGGATAAALEEKGASAALRNREGSTSETLLHHPTLDSDLEGQRIVIVRGNGGRELLADTLRERGAEVDHVEVYQREQPTHDPETVAAVKATIESGELHYVSVMSLATFEYLLELLGSETLSKTHLLTPSRTVVAAAQTLQPSISATLLDEPTPDATIAALRALLAAQETETAMSEDVNVEVKPETETVKPPPVVTAAAPVKKGGRLTGTLALLVSLAALGLSAYTYWRTGNGVTGVTADNSIQEEITSLGSSIDQARRSRDELEGRLGNLGERISDANTRLGTLERGARTRADIVESLPGRVENVEETMAAMQGIAAGTRDNWLRAEAAYYLQLANAQLQLARNPALAAYGLELADERIRKLANPVYTPVRRALAEEIQALRSISGYDHEGIALRLASLTKAAETLPLRNDLKRQTSADDDEAASTDEDASALSRGWSSTKQVLGKAFTIRKTDESVTPLMSPEAAYFLRTNLALKFDTARLALLRGEQISFEQSLADAATWIGEYFDPEATTVKAALATLSELSTENLTVEFPDISSSLTLLRQQTALLSEPAPLGGQTPEPASAEDESTE